MDRERKRLGSLTGERVLAHNLIVGAGTMSAGLLGVAFQSIASHELRPADYGAVFAVVTLLTFIGLPASAFTLLSAREASEARASGLNARSKALLRNGNIWLLSAGTALSVVLGAASPLLSAYFAVPVQLLLAGAVGIPFSLALPLLIGELQGEQRFPAYAAVVTGQAALKLVAAIALGILLGPFGVVVGISIASLAAYLICAGLVRRELESSGSGARWLKPAASYLAIVLPSTLALGVLLSADVLLVKHYFSAPDAGRYAAIAAIGRAIFWGASGIAIVLFPKAVFRSARGRGRGPIVAVSLLLVAAGGLAALAILSVASAWLVAAFSGAAYVAAASYLPWYAIGMMLLGAVAVLNAAHQSTGKAGFLAVLLPCAVLEPAAIVGFHATLAQVVQVVDACMAATAIGLAIWYVVEERSNSASTVTPAADSLRPVPQLQVNR